MTCTAFSALGDFLLVSGLIPGVPGQINRTDTISRTNLKMSNQFLLSKCFCRCIIWEVVRPRSKFSAECWYGPVSRVLWKIDPTDKCQKTLKNGSLTSAVKIRRSQTWLLLLKCFCKKMIWKLFSPGHFSDFGYPIRPRVHGIVDPTVMFQEIFLVLKA